MNLYENKRRWNYLLLVAAMIIAATSLWYTDLLVRGISKSERTRAEVWSQSFKKMFETDNEEMMNYLFTVKDSLVVPAIVTDDKDSIITYTALDTTKTFYKIDTGRVYDPAYFLRQLKSMKAQHEAIPIEMNGKVKYVYYKDSFLLTQLRVFPYIQLSIIGLFLMTAYLIFNSSRRTEQNQVWVGLAKETAHQLGTPISSLMAWVELLKDKFDAEDDPLIQQMENDVKRLEIVADRFSKIGSRPILTSHPVYQTIKDYVDYFSIRVSDKISFEVTGDQNQEALLNVPLFDWVIENLLKNAVNAIEGEGKISVNITENIAKQQIYIDVCDTGKGVPRSKFEAIFQPGFTTRKRGWGLGLSLTRRIIENYHKGQIFVKESELGKGTTFRIIIKSSLNYVPTIR
ncbi:histidine kinase [Pelobium manganitolerans]|uniref:histidine kinase n=1 Tax=Pelobium manganitolerans TaxID=1842495 RepID=A0A419S1L9_9SPHI|nr:HAMP domain-containing sensor histidine kinase [Pelobium manganitolerans]RKD12381.1 histidine kinase [Pelobium manganitolerans]